MTTFAESNEDNTFVAIQSIGVIPVEEKLQKTDVVYRHPQN